MSANIIDINVSLNELAKKANENKTYILNYIDFIIKAYNEILTNNNIPEESEKVIIKIPNAPPIILYNGLSKKSYIELLRHALDFLKINYIIYDFIEKRFRDLKNNDINLAIRYFGDTPAVVVITLDNTKK